MLRTLSCVMIAIVFASPACAAAPSDPFKSSMWSELSERFFGSAPIVFDSNVKVLLPMVTEDQTQVPVTVDARGVSNVQRVVIFADFNPIQHVMTFTPQHAAPYIGFRMKVEQATPVRAAALSGDGVWHVGSAYLDATGGGCTAPAMARKDADWSETVGQSQGRLWRGIDGMARARFRVRHPMDTGLAHDNTPAYYIENIAVRGPSGTALATLETSEPLSEDPTLTLIVRLPPAAKELDIESRDNNGGIYRSVLPASWRQSALGGCAEGSKC